MHEHKRPAPPTRPHNDGVVCRRKNCDKCGWNPEVEKKRKEVQLREKASENGSVSG